MCKVIAVSNQKGGVGKTVSSPELLEMVDQKKIQFVIAVDLSYLDEQIQKWVYEYIKDNGFIKAVQISALKNYPNFQNGSCGIRNESKRICRVAWNSLQNNAGVGTGKKDYATICTGSYSL